VRAIASRIDSARAPKTSDARRPRQRQRCERGGLTILRQLPVRRAGDQPRGGRARCAGRYEIFRFTVGARRRAWRVGRRQPAVREQLHGSHRERVRSLRGSWSSGNRACRRWPPCPRSREALTRRSEGQAVLLRRARHAPGARRLHELRVLPQRR
jgi:hypothetical protein